MKVERIQNTELLLVDSYDAKDNRGRFTKYFQKSNLLDKETNWKESYYSYSKENIFRGFHLQVNEGSHSKLVTCISGCIVDFAVDLRWDKKTFGKLYSVNLKAEKPQSIYIPSGYGHAFYNPSKNDAIVLYLTSSEYDKRNDTGVRWDTIENNWPFQNPITSTRDMNLQTLEGFKKNEYSY